jgi:hypothetical protein
VLGLLLQQELLVMRLLILAVVAAVDILAMVDQVVVVL